MAPSLVPSWAALRGFQCYNVPVCCCEEGNVIGEHKESGTVQIYVGAADLASGCDIDDSSALLYEAMAGINATTSPSNASMMPKRHASDDTCEVLDDDADEGHKVVAVDSAFCRSSPSPRRSPQLLVCGGFGSPLVSSPEVGPGARAAAAEPRTRRDLAVPPAGDQGSVTHPSDDQSTFSIPTETVVTLGPGFAELGRSLSSFGLFSEELISESDFQGDTCFDRFSGFHEVGTLDDDRELDEAASTRTSEFNI